MKSFRLCLPKNKLRKLPTILAIKELTQDNILRQARPTTSTRQPAEYTVTKGLPVNRLSFIQRSFLRCGCHSLRQRQQQRSFHQKDTLNSTCQSFQTFGSLKMEEGHFHTQYVNVMVYIGHFVRKLIPETSHQDFQVYFQYQRKFIHEAALGKLATTYWITPTFAMIALGSFMPPCGDFKCRGSSISFLRVVAVDIMKTYYFAMEKKYIKWQWLCRRKMDWNSEDSKGYKT